MEREVERSCRLEELGGTHFVELPLQCERPGHDPVCAGLLRVLDLLEHQSMLSGCIAEVARARTHEHEDWNRQSGYRLTKELDRGRRAAMRQIGAQLDAIGAARLRRERGLERLDGRLDQRDSTARHGAPSAPTTLSGRHQSV